MNNWDDYYIKTKDNKSSYTLHLALSKFNFKTGHAIDLGCGNGADTSLLIERGWTVTSIDFQEKALRNTYERISPEKRCKVTLIKEKFEDVDLPKADLVIANDSLSFCTPNQFPTLWNRIKDAINSEGRFAGNFFGKKNGLVDDQHSFFESDQIKEILRGFNTEIFLEKDEEGPTASGELWHILRLSRNLCKPPSWCKIETSTWRFILWQKEKLPLNVENNEKNCWSCCKGPELTMLPAYKNCSKKW